MRAPTTISARVVLCLALGVVLASGCMLFTARRQQGKMARMAHLWGTVLIYVSAVLTIWSMVYYLQKALPEIRAKAR